MSRSVASVIAGSEVAGAPGGRLRSVNPARVGEVVAEVALGDAKTFAEAARAARAAQRSWSDVPAPVRGRAIAHMGRLVEANAEALAALVTREIGKPYAEALGEVREIVDTCDLFLGEGRRLYGQTVPSEMPDKQLFTFRNPVGVVAVITAGNFPVAVPSWYLVPALLCGNTVVWKPAEYAAASARALFELLVRGGGLPDGVLNLVLAGGDQTFVGLELALDEGLVDKVGFTGSTRVGARIGELTGRHLQSACLELGGKNPMVVTPSADLELAVAAALFSGFGTAGQRCTSLGTVIAHEDVREEFTGRLDAATRLFYHPAIVAGLREDDALFREETFGPLIGLTGYRDLDEAIRLANAPGYGLSSSIYTRDPAEAFRFRRGISAGMVSVNNSTSGAEAHLPFGGNGKSGNGSRQSGVWVLDQFTRWQSMNWDYSGSLQKAQMDVAELRADTSFRLTG
jgi:acyl-CoA reductase-like NAD-dependent aldehyde dehydrogenase